MTGPRQAEIRYRVDPRDVAREGAAGGSPSLAIELLQAWSNAASLSRTDAGMFDLDAIDLWRRAGTILLKVLPWQSKIRNHPGRSDGSGRS
jgi:hypothetical protein